MSVSREDRTDGDGSRGCGRDRARAAAEQALAELYHASYRRLVTQLYAFTTDLTEAQDVVQEAFARALARPQGLTDVDTPEAWLRTVAINVVRRRWRRRQLLDTILLRDRPVQALVAGAPAPERTDLRDALAALPRTYREVIVLHYLADLPVDEVAGAARGAGRHRQVPAVPGRAALAARLGRLPAGARRRWPMPDLDDDQLRRPGTTCSTRSTARAEHGRRRRAGRIRRRRRAAGRRGRGRSPWSLGGRPRRR